MGVSLGMCLGTGVLQPAWAIENALENGDFETGNLSGWDSSGTRAYLTRMSWTALVRSSLRPAKGKTLYPEMTLSGIPLVSLIATSVFRRSRTRQSRYRSWSDTRPTNPWARFLSLRIHSTPNSSRDGSRRVADHQDRWDFWANLRVSSDRHIHQGNRSRNRGEAFIVPPAIQRSSRTSFSHCALIR